MVVGNGKFSLTAMTMMVGGATTTLTLLRGGGCTRSKKGMHPHQLPFRVGLSLKSVDISEASVAASVGSYLNHKITSAVTIVSRSNDRCCL